MNEYKLGLPTSKLRLVLRGLHLEDVWDDRVDLDVADESREEELFQHVGLQRPERGEAEEEVLEAAAPVDAVGGRVFVVVVVGGAHLLQLRDGLLAQVLDLLRAVYPQKI